MRVRNSRDIGAAIRQRRRELGLDQRSVASRVGVSRQWLIECEKGKPRAELDLVLRTMAVLGLRVDVGHSTAPARKREVAATAPDIDAIVDAARKPRR